MVSPLFAVHNRQFAEMAKQFVQEQEAYFKTEIISIGLSPASSQASPKCVNCGAPILESEEVCGPGCARAFYGY